MKGKTDIRIKFTQKILQDSLVTLLEKKSILQITIKEICELAEVSRSTFYTYYKDQYELLRQIQEQLIMELDKLQKLHLSKVKKTGSPNVTESLQNIFQYFANNKNICKAVLSENSTSASQKYIFNKAIGFFKVFTEIFGSKSQNKILLEYSYVFVINGMGALIQEWLKNDLDIPVPELAKMSAKLINGAMA
jgi:AcrR family transcriptional regulator